MIISLALALLATISGTLATYLYDEGASLVARLCTGACFGLAALGLVGFVFASLLGLTPLAIGLTVIVLVLPFFALKNPARSGAVLDDISRTFRIIRRGLLRPDRPSSAYFVFYLTVTAILWQVFDRAMIDLPAGIYTGVLNNFGDLPFHISVITSFAYGNNFPPSDPTYSGVQFTYPFLSDFISAMFVRCGADLRESMFIENFILAISFVGLLHRWAWELLRDRLAAIITPLLVLLNGGLGWVLLWNDAKQNEHGLLGALRNLSHSYTVIPETTWRWGNAISTLLIPQRGILLGLPLAVIVFTQWWMAGETATRRRGDSKKNNSGTGILGKARKSERETGRRGNEGESNRRSKLGKHERLTTRNRAQDLRVSPVHQMIAAGIVAGLLPLVHAHSFVVVMTIGGCLALIQRRWRDWALFFVVALLIAGPQMWWSTHASAVDAKKFLEWQFGWDRGEQNAVWFWFKNTGLFIPLTLAAIFWRNENHLVTRRLLLFYLPFTLCFIVPNFVKMAPWIWDNIKVLFYWWLASAPLVALLLSRLWQQGLRRRMLAVSLVFFVTLAGALDVAGIVLSSPKYQIFDWHGIEFAELVRRQTEPRSLILHAPVHNHPVFLTGRKSFMGYPGHIWTHGLKFEEREAEIKRIYSGMPDAEALIKRNTIEYAVVSPLERSVMNVNDQFFSRFEKVGEVGEYRLYKVTAP